ncbi:MAG TPA: hypothetical protein VHG08_10425 [Longimicrobium sp.]|nr:hypothetical protein [Longimicrobium sp.]
MTISTDPTPRGPRSPVCAVVTGAALFAAAVLLSQLLLSLVFPEPEGMPPLPVWVRFAAVLAVAGTFVGAVMYRANRLPHGWLRSYLYGTVFSLFMGAEIREFAGTPLHRWLLQWVLVSLVVGILMGAIFRALDRVDAPRPAG